MSAWYGKTFQMAYVVPDAMAAVDLWTTKLGVGPFFTFPLPLQFEGLKVRGEPIPGDADIFGAVEVGYSGDMMIEFIQPGSVRTTYTEFLESGQKGLHHIGTFVDDFDAVLADAERRGVDVLLQGELPMSKFAYLDTASANALTPIVEIVQPFQAMLDTFAMIKQAAVDWDGVTKTISL